MSTYHYRPYHRLRAQAASLSPVFTGMGVIEATRDDRYPRHRHGDYEVILPVAGVYRCLVNEQRVELPARTGALVIKPGDWHEDLLSADSRHIGVWFRLALAGESETGASLPLFADGVLPDQQAVRTVEPWLERCGELLLGEYQRVDTSSAAIQQGALVSLFWLLVRHLDPACLCPAFRQHHEDRSFPSRLAALFRQHDGQPFEVGAMAQELNLSVRRLEELCRERLKDSPARAYAAFRMERAASLLRDTDLAVRAVADRLGFANPYHFARAFSRHFGTPPSEYRNAQREGSTITRKEIAPPRS